MLIVTHEMAFARDVSNRILFLRIYVVAWMRQERQDLRRLIGHR